MKVYLLWHARDSDNEIDVKLLGVYSSEQLAGSAKAKALLLPGFRENPSAFHLDCYQLDEDHWTAGFVTVRFGGRETEDSQPGVTTS